MLFAIEALSGFLVTGVGLPVAATLFTLGVREPIPGTLFTPATGEPFYAFALAAFRVTNGVNLGTDHITVAS